MRHEILNEGSSIWSDMWLGGKKFGRLQLSLIVYRHHYRNSPDRWVIQPCIVYDRKDNRDVVQ